MDFSSLSDEELDARINSLQNQISGNAPILGTPDSQGRYSTNVKDPRAPLKSVEGSPSFEQSKPSSEEVKVELNAQLMRSNSNNILHQIDAAGGRVPWETLAPNWALDSIAEPDRAYAIRAIDNAQLQMADAIARLKSGAAVNAQEEARFKKLLPAIGDDYRTIVRKTIEFEDLGNSIINRSQGKSPKKLLSGQELEDAIDARMSERAQAKKEAEEKKMLKEKYGVGETYKESLQGLKNTMFQRLQGIDSMQQAGTITREQADRMRGVVHKFFKANTGEDL